MNEPLCHGGATKYFDPWFSDDPDDQEYARSVCRRCPVLSTCRVHALVNDFPYGIFAGLDPVERKPMREKMFKELPPDSVAELMDKYFIQDVVGDQKPVIDPKYRRRRDRAEQCKQMMLDIDPAMVGRKYNMWMNCLNAVLNYPSCNGEELGKVIGRCSTAFNQHLRECFEYFDTKQKCSTMGVEAVEGAPVSDPSEVLAHQSDAASGGSFV